jgi:hypothetical protein
VFASSREVVNAFLDNVVIAEYCQNLLGSICMSYMRVIQESKAFNFLMNNPDRTLMAQFIDDLKYISSGESQYGFRYMQFFRSVGGVQAPASLVGDKSLSLPGSPSQTILEAIMCNLGFYLPDHLSRSLMSVDDLSIRSSSVPKNFKNPELSFCDVVTAMDESIALALLHLIFIDNIPSSDNTVPREEEKIVSILRNKAAIFLPLVKVSSMLYRNNIEILN